MGINENSASVPSNILNCAIPEVRSSLSWSPFLDRYWKTKTTTNDVVASKQRNPPQIEISAP